MLGNVEALPDCEVNTMMVLDHTAYAAVGRVETELIGLPGKALPLDVTRKPVGCTIWCSTDTVDVVHISMWFPVNVYRYAWLMDELTQSNNRSLARKQCEG